MYPQVAGHIKVNRELNSMRLLLRVRDRNSRPLFPQGQEGATTLTWVKEEMGRD